MANKPANKVDQLSNNNYFIVLLLISLLVVGGTALGVKTFVGGIILDTKVYSAKDKANKQLDENIKNAPQLVDSYNNLGSKKDLIADALPNTSDFPGLMALMENLAGSTGVSLKSITPSQTAQTTATGVDPNAAAGTGTGTGGTASASALKPEPQPYAVSLAFDASYSALSRLLLAIEQSARPMRVTSLQLSGSGGSLAVQMEVSTYYQDKAELPFSTETIK